MLRALVVPARKIVCSAFVATQHRKVSAALSLCCPSSGDSNALQTCHLQVQRRSISLDASPSNRATRQESITKVLDEIKKIMELLETTQDPKKKNFLQQSLERRTNDLHLMSSESQIIPSFETSGNDSSENDAVAIWKSLQGCNLLTLKNLSDPKFSVQMPWPSTLVAQLDRMTLVQGNMDIVGREFFGELYRHTISHRKLSRVNVMGTKGIGKSYRLAALVGLLLKEGRRVVYLPNCGASCESLESDLRAALLVAFGDDSSATIRQQIAGFHTREQLAEFCSLQPGESLIFVLDQFNGVQEDSTHAAGKYSGSKQESARDFLKKISHEHISVLGYSANNYTALVLMETQRYEFDFCIFGGLTEAEFEQWCRTNERVFATVDASELDHCKADLRVASGGNPLMLDSFCDEFQYSVGRSFKSCVDTWSTKQAGKIFREMINFIGAHNRSASNVELNLAQEALLACMSGGMLTSGPSHFDHRHMFQVPSRGRISAAFIASPFLPADWYSDPHLAGTCVCTSGISNAAASKILRTFNAENRFLQADYISNALKAVNPVVLGFQVERILLATISQSGLDGAPVSKVEYFRDASHLRSIFRSASHHNTLYIPEQWNYPRIDAVLVLHHKPSSSKKAKKSGHSTASAAHVQFIQITIASITEKKIENIRSVLLDGSEERLLWRQAVPDAAEVRFSLRWLVKRDQVKEIPKLEGPKFKGVAEQVSSIESLNRALQL